MFRTLADLLTVQMVHCERVHAGLLLERLRHQELIGFVQLI